MKDRKRQLTIILIIVAILLVPFSLYSLVYADKILPRVHVGTVDVGGLTRDQAVEKIRDTESDLKTRTLVLNIGSNQEAISLDRINFSISSEGVEKAYEVGRVGFWPRKILQRLSSPLIPVQVPAAASYDEQALDDEIATLGEIIDQPRKDIRFDIHGTQVGILYDTQPGKIIDYPELKSKITQALSSLNFTPINIGLVDDIPRADIASVPKATQEARQMLQSSLSLSYGDRVFIVPAEQIGSWIISGYTDNQLIPLVNTRLVSSYVTQVASQIDSKAQKPTLRVENGKVVEFVPPRPGVALSQDETVQLIVQALNARRSRGSTSARLPLPVKTVTPESPISSDYKGIVELIGRATTPFTGSPSNRIHNIKNGVQFLTGTLVQPGEEFSTLKTLGTIDNTTGYLPELVIKGDHTIPEFGGGLCQVSTTLFRAVLNAGLPITARRNHSYRVSYYEKDGQGNFIGPGLDATIYEPDLDFRFKNDTDSTILIYGYTIGDKATFELYGTKDGRTAKVDGPYKLSETAPGDPIYIQTDTLPAGTTKQIETPHPGGSAVARYYVTYPDGHEVKQEFYSYYRRWPAQFLVGTGTSTQ